MLSLGKPRDGHADEAGSDQGAEKPMPKIDSARPVATWLAMQRQRQHGEQQRQRRARQDAAERCRAHGDAGGQRDAEAGDRADQHHAFDAEIQDAGFLGDQLAQGGEHQRRRGDTIETVIRTRKSIMPWRPPGGAWRECDADAVADEEVCREQEEQQHALEHAASPPTADRASICGVSPPR